MIWDWIKQGVEGVLAPVTKIVEGWQERKTKQQEHDNAIEMKKVEIAATMAQQQQLNDSTWEKIWSEGAQHSWKDEYWTFLVSVPLIMCFIPDLAPYVKQGFDVLRDSVPDWYIGIISASVAAAYGIRPLVGAIKRRVSG